MKTIKLNGRKKELNKGREFEKTVLESFGMTFTFDNQHTTNGADIELTDKQLDLKTERGSIRTQEGDARRSKDLDANDKKEFIVEQLGKLWIETPSDREYWFRINAVSMSKVYVMTKAQWFDFMLEFAKVDNATDFNKKLNTGHFLKIRLDAKSDKAYALMQLWLSENRVNTITL